ncbi:MAG: reverse transcriptase domain-containing protein [Bacteriovoracaceae bacterium]
MPSFGKLYKSVYRQQNLVESWEVVKQNGLQSKSDTTKQQIRDFELVAKSRIKKLHEQLKKKAFTFSMSRGVPIRREGKDDRPLVVSPVENRIVQRAILNVLQRKEHGIFRLVNNGTSFGGIEEKSVSDALKLVAKKTQAGAKFFARSDIKSFFTKIPKPEVMEIIKDSLKVKDEQFEALLELAIKVELDNLDSLGSKASLFPLDDTGVAQGSCLSPLLGNIFLKEFDVLSNSPDVTCIRFVDDYVILGPDEKSVKSKFLAGKKWLNDRGLDVYDPFTSGDKGEFGPIHIGFEFLGCDVYPGRISPSTKGVDKFKEKISLKIKDAFRSNNPLTLAEVLVGLKNTVLGWGNSYQFCNDRGLIEKLDGWLIEEIGRFHEEYLQKLSENPCKAALISKLGVATLSSCKSNPIYGKKKTGKGKGKPLAPPISVGVLGVQVTANNSKQGAG